MTIRDVFQLFIKSRYVFTIGFFSLHYKSQEGMDSVCSSTWKVPPGGGIQQGHVFRANGHAV